MQYSTSHMPNFENLEELICRKRLAKRWQISEKTLANWVYQKIGPAPVKVAGRLVRYRLSDIIAAEQSGLPGGRKRRRKSDADKGDAS